MGCCAWSSIGGCICACIRVFPFKKLPKFLQNLQMIRKWMLKSRLHHLTPKEEVPVIKFVSHPMEKQIASALVCPHGGIFVLWGPKGAGRTSYVKHVAILRLQHEKKLTAYLDGKLFSGTQLHSPGQWFWDAMQLDQSQTHNFENDLPPPRAGGGPLVGIVIDNFDSLIRTSECQDFFCMLLNKSTTSKRFNVLVCVDSQANRDILLSNTWGAQLINENLAAMAWNTEQIQTLAEAMIQKYDPRRCETACTPTLIARSKSPGLIIDAIRLKSTHEIQMLQRAAQVNLQYTT